MKLRIPGSKKAKTFVPSSMFVLAIAGCTKIPLFPDTAFTAYENGSYKTEKPDLIIENVLYEPVQEDRSRLGDRYGSDRYGKPVMPTLPVIKLYKFLLFIKNIGTADYSGEYLEIHSSYSPRDNPLMTSSQSRLVQYEQTVKPGIIAVGEGVRVMVTLGLNTDVVKILFLIEGTIYRPAPKDEMIEFMKRQKRD